MLNVKSTNSPITVIHEDTKLILEALKNIDPILENKPVRLPLLVTDRMIPIKDRNKNTATFVGLMFLDFDNDFYFVEDATYFSDRIKVAVPILVNHHLVLNKTEEKILKLLEENLKFFSSLSTNKKLIEETELIILASEMVSALIASDQNDHQSIITFESQKIEKLFSYVFFWITLILLI